MAGAADTSHVECPRCAYDLSGVIATWNDTCDIDGVCSECGYDFAWADLLREDRRIVAWLYEHTNSWLRLGPALITTWRVLFPWSFWARVQVHHPPRLRRVILLLFLILLPGLLIWTAYAASTYWLVPWAWSAPPPGSWPRWTPPTYSIADVLQRLHTPFFTQGRYGGLRLGMSADSAVLAIIALSAGFAISVTVAHSARIGAKVRASLILRVFFYSLVPLALLTVFQLAFLASAEWDGIRATRIYALSGYQRLQYDAPILTFFQEWYWTGVRNVVVVGITLWLLPLWSFAVVRGMHLRGAWQIILAGLAIGSLSAITLVSAVDL